MNIKKLETLRAPDNSTLWGHCLFEEIKECKEQGKTEVEFSDVDKRVAELAKRIIKWEEQDTTTMLH